MSMEVIEEEDVDGEGYYVVEMAFDPPMDDFLSTVFAKVSKALYLPERMDANATYMGEEVSMSTMGTYDFHGSARWPLAVGNEYTVTENLTTIITAMGTTESENESQTNTYKVEALEDITVPAGTFECFRVVEYDETGGKMVTTWYSDQVRNTVREEDHETGGTQDLVSYSLK